MAEAERQCVQEWCENGAAPHSDECDNAPMSAMTKHEWIEFQEVAAHHAIEAYRVLSEEGFAPDEAAAVAIDEVNESATCYAGIGSCGRGLCRHG